MNKLIDWKNLEEKPYEPLIPLIRQLSADGCVLLKNEGGILPLKKEDKISLFGRTQIDYNKSGTGSGGLVRVDYVVNILDGIRNNEELTLNEDLVKVYTEWLKENPFDVGAGWAQEPWCQFEMVPDEEIVIKAKEASDVAVIVLGRTAGEDKDNSAEVGSWYLTPEENELLKVVSKHFEKTVVLLNVGNIIDMSWVERYDIKAVMYVWQGGQEGGNAVADVLSGRVTPSGKLSDTIAKHIDFYPSTKNFGGEERNIYAEDIYVGYRYFETFAPDEVLYPFGFGLSYTDFEYSIKSVKEENDIISLDVEVKNTGNFDGRETVEVYFEAPQGMLGKSKRELCAFCKTGIIGTGKTETVHIEFSVNSMTAYDDSGITGNKSCYVMEAGDYIIYCGKDVRRAEPVYTYSLDELKVVEKCNEALSPYMDFDIIYPKQDDNGITLSYKKASKRTVDYKERIKRELPKEIEITGDKGIKLSDVKSGKNSMEEFVAQMTVKELMDIVHGEGMCSPKVRPGNAGAIGGITEELCDKGIPLIAVHDGPSGIRMDSGEKATSLPNGTAIACSWDVVLAEELFENLSIELCTHRIDSVLGPGINIHRTPLNGRNFEYFSEDPYLTGKLAAAMTRGVKKYGNSATIKHFFANSQEHKRREVDSVMSERAAREIYLKGFETAVKEGNVTSIMTSYNPINGIWAANNYDLNTVILRKEWGYGGFVMTDWWPKLSNDDGEILNLKELVEAQNDVYMLTSDVITCKDNLKEAFDNGEITVGQLQRNTINILNYLMDSHSFERFEEYGGGFEKSMADEIEKYSVVFECDDVTVGEEIKGDFKNAGKCLLSLEYSSDNEPIVQMSVYLWINNINAACLTVNGTEGKNVTIYRDFSLSDPNSVIKFVCSEDKLKIKKIKFYM